jgi:uncharacterized protein
LQDATVRLARFGRLARSKLRLNFAEMMRKKSWPDEELRLPIKLGATSNGEYVPAPPSPRIRWVQQQALLRADEYARRLGVTRRDFLRSSAGAATVLLTLNGVSGCGGSYQVPQDAPLEPAAADSAVGGDEFIFDVQTHHVATERRWWPSHRQTMADYLKTTPKARCGRDPIVECFSEDEYLKDVFLDSDTDMAVLSALWGTPDINAILPEEAVRTRERFQKMDGAPRLVLHGVVYGKSQSPAQRAEWMKKLVEDYKINVFKLYPVWSPDGKGYRLDDPETGMSVIQQALEAGVRIFAVHKGLKLPGMKGAFTSAIDVGAAARAFPSATFLIYHSGYDSDRDEGPYDPSAQNGVDALIRGLAASGVGKNGNVYAELGAVWREVMKDTDQAAHVLGKLLAHLGEDRILWGTDAIWYGSPQDQIQAFRAFQISPEFQERFGYPALTPETKRKIFGLNAARVYGIDAGEIRRAQAWDPVARARAEYRNFSNPSFVTHGPRTRRELFDLLRSEG